MIITFTPNPAIDMTYDVADVRVGETHAVSRVRERAGGKGVNTAAVLTAMGTGCVALCPTGQDDLTAFAADLDARGIAHDLVAVPGRVRRSAAAVEPGGRATVFNEPGTAWPASDVSARLGALLPSASVCAVCGSVPRGAESGVLQTIRETQAASVPVVLDLRGDVLREALAAGPDLVKPNRSEAADTLGLDQQEPPPAIELARGLIRAGARNAAVSDGERGVTLATAEGIHLHATLPTPVQGNPTGAGDALTAALATHLSHRPTAWREALTDGVAYAAAAVLQPVAGQVDPEDVRRLRPQVEVTELT